MLQHRMQSVSFWFNTFSNLCEEYFFKLRNHSQANIEAQYTPLYAKDATSHIHVRLVENQCNANVNISQSSKNMMSKNSLSISIALTTKMKTTFLSPTLNHTLVTNTPQYCDKSFHPLIDILQKLTLGIMNTNHHHSHHNIGAGAWEPRQFDFPPPP